MYQIVGKQDPAATCHPNLDTICRSQARHPSIYQGHPEPWANERGLLRSCFLVANAVLATAATAEEVTIAWGEQQPHGIVRESEEPPNIWGNSRAHLRTEFSWRGELLTHDGSS